MQTSLNPEQLQKKIRDAIQRKFADLVRDVKAGPGSLVNTAKQVGVSRTALDQYAKGAVPGSDVLLMAFLGWDWTIRIENEGGTPSWCEFSMSDVDGGVQQRRPEPIQLSLFDALTDLGQNIEVIKKSVGRVEAELDLALKKRA